MKKLTLVFLFITLYLNSISQNREFVSIYPASPYNNSIEIYKFDNNDTVYMALLSSTDDRDYIQTFTIGCDIIETIENINILYSICNINNLNKIYYFVDSYSEPFYFYVTKSEFNVYINFKFINNYGVYLIDKGQLRKALQNTQKYK